MTEGQGKAPEVLTREQTAIFASGLRYVASVDGITDDELGVIRELATDAGHADLADNLDTLHFDIDRAAAVLDSSFLRGLFIKACILLVRADGKISEEERVAVRFLASALGRNDDVAELEQELAEQVEGQP